MAVDLPQCGGVGDAGGNAVVDDDHGAIAQREGLAVAPVGLDPATQLYGLTLDDAGQLSSVYLQQFQRLLIEDPGATLGDRADAVLGVVEGAELAHCEDLEWSSQPCRDLIGYRDPPAGQANDQRPLLGERQQLPGKLPARVGAIGKDGRWAHARALP